VFRVRVPPHPTLNTKHSGFFISSWTALTNYGTIGRQKVAATDRKRPQSLKSLGLGLKCRPIVSQNRSLVASGGQPDAENVPTKTKSTWQIDLAIQSHDDSRPSVNSDCLVSHSNLHSGVGGSAVVKTIYYDHHRLVAFRQRHHCGPLPSRRENRAAHALMPPLRWMNWSRGSESRLRALRDCFLNKVHQCKRKQRCPDDDVS
jgi:hypothetical protein